MQKPFSNGDTKRLIVCDFDGTITEKDNIVDIIRAFAPPECEEIIQSVLQKECSIREGVGRMFAYIPSSLKSEIVQFVLERVKIRPGFHEFVTAIKADPNTSLVIVSGGIDFFVHPVLGDIDVPVYCNHGNFDGKTIQIEWPFACDDQCQNDCGCCKPSVIRSIATGDERIIAIGDSVTDVEMAKRAELVFARDYLLKECETHHWPHEPFKDFHDIVAVLQEKEGISI
ncbi:2-hydroxy-3-keto-5-methylthiopentenyl-1-phosphate phosphatase [Aureibacillus halotolerans]|uniref:2-hydroxy-3-keto-5-methylthiopentenyl-1-phosphate phosphatase n=1 Tax=Aureibacillus halotolerans TaxID=1508390 RepID=A0A4R6U4S0_9BACI|nr:2-hydroxy-3-keto-5-methylthiopentenyl-1-phosphate phosphatase [Aureibacillus halotolerans]TDQ39793.1 2-hydroxy-3-keto-5-methylthiopentenyl-1-phosphate phosphatase [Aureibacillus halotolerans]